MSTTRDHRHDHQGDSKEDRRDAQGHDPEDHQQLHHHQHHDPDSPELRTEALEALLAEKGLIDPSKIDQVVQRYEEEIGPMNGARVVARAWVDPEYKKRLLADGKSAVQELGVDGAQIEHLVVKENKPGVHNVVVCTLCSCYPWAVLGLPPSWYKDPAYRSRVVREPRAVLAEMGLDLDASSDGHESRSSTDPEIEVRVWDSSAEVRYMVLPERPAGTENLSEEELAAMVGRDAMIGVARAGGAAGAAGPVDG